MLISFAGNRVQMKMHAIYIIIKVEEIILVSNTAYMVLWGLCACIMRYITMCNEWIALKKKLPSQLYFVALHPVCLPIFYLFIIYVYTINSTPCVFRFV